MVKQGIIVDVMDGVDVVDDMPMAYYVNIEERATKEVEEAKEKYGDEWWLHVGLTNLFWWLDHHGGVKHVYSIQLSEM